MACHLDDLALRRTTLAARGHPDEAALKNAASLMANRLNWNDDQMQEELDSLNRR